MKIDSYIKKNISKKSPVSYEKNKKINKLRAANDLSVAVWLVQLINGSTHTQALAAS